MCGAQAGCVPKKKVNNVNMPSIPFSTFNTNSSQLWVQNSASGLRSGSPAELFQMDQQMSGEAPVQGVGQKATGSIGFQWADIFVTSGGRFTMIYDLVIDDLRVWTTFVWAIKCSRADRIWNPWKEQVLRALTGLISEKWMPLFADMVAILKLPCHMCTFDLHATGLVSCKVTLSLSISTSPNMAKQIKKSNKVKSYVAHTCAVQSSRPMQTARSTLKGWKLRAMRTSSLVRFSGLRWLAFISARAAWSNTLCWRCGVWLEECQSTSNSQVGSSWLQTLQRTDSVDSVMLRSMYLDPCSGYVWTNAFYLGKLQDCL